ncbi:protein serine/threonine phosphatase 2C [Fragilariopsis cylindrus CCMP1102]|uniref:protein-serine/threonine phosphatase n=1 Tax=Fragilariopsis cylindrus CCMP1102 TaxID=635003 RepID=A0A1E7ELY6_9STRA|nr:protein serine/threonine phosphatase 2C [Fragilariopsis cylindrus CCMP1102]|eukprot:OEU06942.1 protein serine/threonine phosphatase 2C [Fragilariopsis cylindrus CCMP1102]
MGNLLGSPITEKETHTGETTGDEKLKYGLSSMQGWRVHMEDAHIAEVNLYALDTTKNAETQIKLQGHSLFACYDGHGGTFAAIYAGNNFLRILSKQRKFVEYAKLCATETTTTTEINAPIDDESGDSGTTACVVMITPDSIVCANAGDSRAVFARPIPLSFDHKPEDEEETLRIRTAGGYVAGGRVEGDLAVSRGLGDFRFKQMPIGGDDNDSDDSDSEKPILFSPGKQKVSPIPDVIVHTRQHSKDEYIIVACDGIWDVVSNIQCIHEIDTIMYTEGEKDLGLVSEEILDSCLQFGSKDNMTAIVIQLPACELAYNDAKNTKNDRASKTNKKQEGVLGRRRERTEGDAAANGTGDGGTTNLTDGGNRYADAFDTANDNDDDDDDVDVEPKYM